ncbi:8770_t:CDS:2 [Rhizophagus irregularis]|nr:8770_t:CDS:2 [Rhizophagus irregularis]
MPVWTWEEINYCRQKLFDNLDENMVMVDTCDEKIFQYIGGSNIREDVSHILVHMWTNVPEDNNVLRDEESTVDEGEVKYIAEEYYTETIIKFASDYVGRSRSMPKQNFVTPKDDISWRLPRCIKDHVKQYVLGIDLSSGDFGNLPRTSSTATIEEGVSTIGEPSASNVASSDSIIPAKGPLVEIKVKGVKGKKKQVSKNAA